MSEFCIVLVKGIDYLLDDQYQFKKYFEAIRNSFSLLSWIIPDYQIRIKNEIIINQNTTIKIFTKDKKVNGYFLRQRRQGNSIFYSIGLCSLEDIKKIANVPAQQFCNSEAIEAKFRSDGIQQLNILIRCKDKNQISNGLSFNQLFQNDDSHKILQNRYKYFRPPCIGTKDKISTPTHIEYYYIQPENQRYYEDQQIHLNLAFQGGGAKGVSYVGVNKAILSLQQRIRKESDKKINLPIKSVIGSSAGGILSLAISAAIQQTDLIDLCYMMDTLIEDLLIPTVPQAEIIENNPSQFNQKYNDKIKPNFFEQQQQALKNLLHNLGLVERSMSDLIFQTLKQPSVQQRLFNLFKALNPSIGSLLSFKDNRYYEGQSIKNCLGTCCCCCYSNCLWNCCGNYPCCQNIPGAGCFIEKSNKYQRVNVYGLLYAALMTGDAVQNILAYAISLFFEIQAKKNPEGILRLAKNKKWFNLKDDDQIIDQIIQNSKELRQKYKGKKSKQDKSYLQNDLIELAKKLTLRQYYQLAKVQFTCTSVDLHDKIQRFFNHKTTPQLPVCKAVQMTGSFPAVFLSLQWKQQWGKYYVHYDRTRAQINLTGHHFTDGGLLANFPLKFLDNQKFRQKYFSHKNVQSKTFLYGFGLDQLQNYPEQNNQQQISACVGNLLSEIKYRLILKIGLNLIKCSSKSTKQVKKMKLLDFMMDLIDALKQSDRNLNKQCFKYEMVQTNMAKRPIYNNQDLKLIKKPVEEFISKFRNQVEQHKDKPRDKYIEGEINTIFKYGKYKNQKFLDWSQVQQINRNIQNFLSYIPKYIPIYQETLQKLKSRFSLQNPFFTSVTLHHKEQILKILKSIKQYLQQLGRQQFQQLKANIYQSSLNLFQYIRDISQNILSHNISYIDADFNNKKPDKALSYLQFKYKISPYMLQRYNQFQEPVRQKHIAIFFNSYVQENVLINRLRIRNRIRDEIIQKQLQFQQRRQKKKLLCKQKDQILKTSSNPKIHIILQAKYFSHYYYPDYIKIVQQVIADKNTQIDIITCTHYHAIYGILLTLNYKTSKIKQKLSQVHLKFQKNKDIENNYNSKEWMKTSIEKVTRILKRQWQKIQGPFEYIEDNQYQIQNVLLQKNRLGLNKKFNQIKNHIECEQQYINQAFQKILDYISASFVQISKLQKDKRQDRFQQLLSLGKYEKVNARRSKIGQKVLSHFLNHTINLMMIAAGHLIKNQQSAIVSSQKWRRQTIFKGMIINSLINTIKYRLFIFEILDQSGLDRNITLKKFYDLCPRKILLNFNCLDTTMQRFALINKITKPNMPLWAALMSAASLPFLSGQFGSRRQWQMKEKGDLQLQKADVIFKNYEVEGSGNGSNYISGNFISTLPIELMTNQRLINSKLTQNSSETDVTEIVFAFDASFNLTSNYHHRPQLIQQQAIKHNLVEEKQNYENVQNFFQKIPKLMNNKRKFINFGDALKYLCQYIFMCCCKLDIKWYFSDMMSQINTLKLLNIRINSHDNLILNLYYDKLIKLPLRIGTLDFYKISKDKPDLFDTIRQANEVVRQLCDTIHYDKINDKLIFKPSNQSTIQLSSHKANIYNTDTKSWQNNKLFYRIKFISYTKWRDFKYRYIIQYSLDSQQRDESKVKWSRLLSDHIDVNHQFALKKQYKMLVKFIYYDTNLISNIYLLDLRILQNLPFNYGRAIFSINYRKKYSSIQDAINQQYKRIGSVSIKSYFLPKGSRECNNLDCDCSKLEYCLREEKKASCYLCRRKHDEANKNYTNLQYIAMRCPKCKQNYCIKCKINNFIVRYQLQQDMYRFVSPKNNKSKQKQTWKEYTNSYAPIIYKSDSNQHKSNCLYCDKYSYKLFHQKNITSQLSKQDEFCGLRICQICALIIEV